MKVLPGPHNKIFELFKVLSGFLGEEVERHQKDIDPNNPRDYIDAFLIEMEKVCEQLLDMYTLLQTLYIIYLFYIGFTVFLNSTKINNWASLSPIFFCAQWICSWQEQRQQQPQCFGGWSTSSNILMFKVSAMLEATLW